MPFDTDTTFSGMMQGSFVAFGLRQVHMSRDLLMG